jgi:hypothetical protein
MDANSIADLFESAAATVAVARLIHLDLARRFPALLAWLIVLGTTDFAFSLLPQNSFLYFWIYVGAEPVACVFGILAVRELLAIVFRDYPGIRSVGRWCVYAALALAGTASVGASMVFSRDRSHSSIHLLYIEVLQRSVVFTLALVILTVMFALSRYPLNLGRNSIVSSVFFSAIFLSDAVRLLVDSLSTALNNQFADLTEATVIFLCLGTWAVLLLQETARMPVIDENAAEKALEGFTNPAEAQLLSELDSLNRLLTRAARH